VQSDGEHRAAAPLLLSAGACCTAHLLQACCAAVDQYLLPLGAQQ